MTLLFVQIYVDSSSRTVEGNSFHFKDGSFHMIRSLLDEEMQEKIIVVILEKDLNFEDIVNLA